MVRGEPGGVRIAAWLIIVALIAPFMASSAASEENVLKVLNYSEYIDPEVLKIFEEMTGIRVVYDEFEAAEEAWAKLKVGGAGYDLIIIAHSYVQLAIDQGLVRKIDKSMIPNLANLDPLIAGHPADPRQDYAVPYMWGTTGIAYVEGCVADPPRSWRQLFDEDYISRYSGKVSLLSEFSEVFEAAMIALGYDPSVRDNWNGEVAREVARLVGSIKEHLVGFYGASEYMPALANEQICIAQAWNGDVLVVREENPRVNYVTPEDGTLFWVDYMLIPRDAENVEAAHKFINFLLDPEIAARNVKFVWYAASIKKDLLVDLAESTGDSELMEILEDPLVYPPENARLIPSPVLDQEMNKLLEETKIAVQTGEVPGERSSLPLYALMAIVVAAAIALIARKRA
ncbi:MAG: spermidine/putrescine ABC transporter substrate-binding protein [Desulfurococcales archaeon]|nr:spermidine/putrescine ABC transporter substrate-binding protein [Desulfurococcales archaeon]